MERWIAPLSLLLILHGGPLLAADAASCTALRDVDFSTIRDAPAQVLRSSAMPAEGELPAFCHVEGYIVPRINFELRLPLADWNERVFMQGCGGFCGFINVDRANDALQRGYATLSSDLGSSSTAVDGKWGYNNRQGEIDFGFRGTHVAIVAAKALVEHFYGTRPRYSYYRGCSTGGRQGLVEAQQFPGDFDGIIAGAPPMNEVLAATVALGYPIRANQDAQGRPILPVDKLPALNAAAIAACDSTDGIDDGIIGDPRRCRFDPATLLCTGPSNDTCLTEPEIEVVNKIYAGPRNSAGEPLMRGGPPPGSELRWAGYLGITSRASGNLRLMYTDFLRYMAFDQDPGPSYDPSEFDYDEDLGRLQFMERFYNAENPDLRPFERSGGKLILHLGLQDTAPQERVIDYFETVSRVMGGRERTQAFFRLFLIPGMNHCSGGPGADTVDWITAIEDWVERDKAPDRLIAYRQVAETRERYPDHPLPPERIELTRPLFPYPDYAIYSGSGDPNQADSFIRATPDQESAVE